MPLRPTLYRYFSKFFSGKYQTYQFILLQRDYLCETSVKKNVATKKA